MFEAMVEVDVAAIDCVADEYGGIVFAIVRMADGINP